VVSILPVMARRRRTLGIVALAGLLATVWGLIGWALPLPTQPAVEGVTLHLSAGTEEIAVLPGFSRRDTVWRPLSTFPSFVTEAVLTAEDWRFFRHRGIDVLAALRAAATNLRQGRIREGGSTITQQLARTIFLSEERSWGRKLREAILALLIEVRYSKPRILEAYLNTVYLGQDGDVAVHGLPAAAQHFLHKDVAAIRPDEAAFLAVAISAPNRRLTDRSGRAVAARDALLRTMGKRGAIDPATIREALARPIPSGTDRAPLRAPYVVELVREEVARRFVLPSSGDVRIATSIDPALQRIAERSVRDGVERIERRQGNGVRGRVEAALVALDPASGSIRALVGGRSYSESPFNRATRARRQPGSLFKPIVYLTAFELGVQERSLPITPASLISDEPLTVRDGSRVWSPKNLDHRLLGSVTVRRAIEESRNVPAVRVGLDVGPERIVDMARRLGIRSPLTAVPSLALGTSEVTLLEITSAYAVLANGGVRVSPTTLAAGGAPVGAQPAEALSPPARMASAESVFLMTHLLRGVMREGTGRASARWGVSEVTAGKSGTSDGLRDAWFVGYTPDLVVGVWVGLDDGSPLGLTGSEAALPIWAATMAAAVRQRPPRPFAAPPGVVFVTVDRDTGRPASTWCNHGRTVDEAFRAGTEPSGGCPDAVLAKAAHGVLGWLRGLFR
jgi:membrane peptidoglycan carboxypeptidase